MTQSKTVVVFVDESVSKAVELALRGLERQRIEVKLASSQQAYSMNGVDLAIVGIGAECEPVAFAMAKHAADNHVATLVLSAYVAHSHFADNIGAKFLLSRGEYSDLVHSMRHLLNLPTSASDTYVDGPEMSLQEGILAATA